MAGNEKDANLCFDCQLTPGSTRGNTSHLKYYLLQANEAIMSNECE